MKAQVNAASNKSHVVSIMLQKEANAPLVVFKQHMMLFPDRHVTWAVKQ